MEESPFSSTPTSAASPMDRYIQYLESQKRPQAFADIASVFGTFADSQKANRTGAMAGVRDQDYLRLAMAAENRAGQEDAWKNLLRSSYLTGDGSFPKMAGPTIRGKQFSLGGTVRGPIADSVRQGATTVEEQALARLGGEGVLEPTDTSDMRSPGIAERIGDYGSMALSGLGMADSLGVLNKIPWLGKLFGGGTGAATAAAAAPTAAGILASTTPVAATAGGFGTAAAGAGAGLGGTIGALMTNPWTIGIGAGLAAIPLLKKAFGGPSQEEKDARGMAGDLISQLVSEATPTQRAEATAAGWENPTEALANIVLRDKIVTSGGTVNTASDLMKQLLDATSKAKDPRAVQSVTKNFAPYLG